MSNDSTIEALKAAEDEARQAWNERPDEPQRQALLKAIEARETEEARLAAEAEHQRKVNERRLAELEAEAAKDSDRDLIELEARALLAVVEARQARQEHDDAAEQRKSEIGRLRQELHGTPVPTVSLYRSGPSSIPVRDRLKELARHLDDRSVRFAGNLGDKLP